MNKEYLIQYLTNGKMDIYEFLYKYCIYKGKPPELTNMFLQTAGMTGLLPGLFGYALKIMCQEYHITIVEDLKTNKILYAYEFKGDTTPDNQEYGSIDSGIPEADRPEVSKETEDAV